MAKIAVRRKSSVLTSMFGRKGSTATSMFVPIGRFLSREGCLKGIKVKKVLGQGAFGTVANACRSNKCKYVLKIQKLVRRRNSFLTQRGFWDEVGVSKKAGDLGISPRIKDAWTCDGNGYMLMNRVNGLTLKEVIKQNPRFELMFDLKNKAKTALKKAHAAGLLHRDIHAENIMVTKKNDVMLIDWGLMPEKAYTKADDNYLLVVAFTDPFLKKYMK